MKDQGTQQAQSATNEKTYYFNTGVKAHNSQYMDEGDIYIKGERHIPFVCAGVPDNASLMYLCDKLDIMKNENVFIAPVIRGNMGKTYAYFAILTHLIINHLKQIKT